MIDAAGVSAGFFQGALELPGSSFVFAKSFVDDAQVIVRHQILGSECQGQFEMLVGRFQLATMKQASARR